MKKKRNSSFLWLLFFPLIGMMIGTIGCEWKQTKSSGGTASSNSGSGTTTSSSSNDTTTSGTGTGASGSSLPAHALTTVNILEMDPFSGQQLNPTFWKWLEAYCQAGPTQLIIADMPLIPGHFTRSIAPGYWAAQMYALASTYAGVNWSPPDDPDAAYYYTIRDQIYLWWDGYVEAVLKVMQKAPKTTAIIVVNDKPDMCGARLGPAIQDRLSPVGDRVVLGEVLWDWR